MNMPEQGGRRPLNFLDDPTWKITFPHRVTPLYEEWFAGLLLRCDEVNHWVSGTAWTYLRQTGFPMKPPFLPYLSVPSDSLIENIASLLALPVREVRNTTYLPELRRYFGLLHPLPGDLQPSLTFRVCPVCLAEERLLKRTLALRYVLYCPWHEAILLSVCSCGTPLQLFDPAALPFTCSTCQRDWADLPRVAPTPERITVTRQLLSCYEYLFFCGKPDLMKRVFHAVIQAWKEEIIRERDHPPRRSSRVHVYPRLASNQVPPLCFLVLNLIKYHLYYDPKVRFWGQEDWGQEED